MSDTAIATANLVNVRKAITSEEFRAEAILISEQGMQANVLRLQTTKYKMPLRTTMYLGQVNL